MIISLRVKGAVQGVGYRPFIANKATEYGLSGQVKNIGAAVDIIVSGRDDKVKSFVELVKNEHPAGALILDVQCTEINDDLKFDSFKIVNSEDIDLRSELPIFLPDIGICNDCMKEMLDSTNRRYKYPLISCASCGPRFSILDKIPYDRETTTMVDFKMCHECSFEYTEGRRRHAQTISCHKCGPQMIFKSFKESDISYKEQAVSRAIDILKNGGIIGLKGISGYQLICKPIESSAIRLRTLKGRENKPFAVMFNTVDTIKQYCKVNNCEEEILTSSARPIVLLESINEFPYEVSKDSRYIGAFLPSAGIHRQICDAIGPIICTSANKSSSPMIIDDDEFLKRFSDTDGVLYHKRRINMAQDDSVIFVTKQFDGSYTSQFIRRARGYNPLPIMISKFNFNEDILALGGDLKSTFAIAKKDRIIPSQYIGDLGNKDNFDLFENYIDRYKKIFCFDEKKIICDKHPLYFSRSYAERNKSNAEIIQIQHHHAHVLSVMAENNITSCIGVSFDGTGYGDDSKIWGGEILLCKNTEYKRVSHLSYLKLSGGDNAPKNAEQIKKCYDHACGYDIDMPILSAALDQNINIYETSSMGRLFDCISALLGINNYNTYEGECAILLEKEAYNADNVFPLLKINIYKDNDGMFIADQLDLYKQIKHYYDKQTYSKSELAYGFHIAIATYVLDICTIIREQYNENSVCLSGGVFANRILLTKCNEILSNNGFNVFWNKLVPSGDSGLSLGQAYFGLLK